MIKDDYPLIVFDLPPETDRLALSEQFLEGSEEALMLALMQKHQYQDGCRRCVLTDESFRLFAVSWLLEASQRDV